MDTISNLKSQKLFILDTIAPPNYPSSPQDILNNSLDLYKYSETSVNLTLNKFQDIFTDDKSSLLEFIKDKIDQVSCPNTLEKTFLTNQYEEPLLKDTLSLPNLQSIKIEIERLKDLSTGTSLTTSELIPECLNILTKTPRNSEEILEILEKLDECNLLGMKKQAGIFPKISRDYLAAVNNIIKRVENKYFCSQDLIYYSEHVLKLSKELILLIESELEETKLETKTISKSTKIYKSPALAILDKLGLSEKRKKTSPKSPRRELPWTDVPSVQEVLISKNEKDTILSQLLEERSALRTDIIGLYKVKHGHSLKYSYSSQIPSSIIGLVIELWHKSINMAQYLFLTYHEFAEKGIVAENLSKSIWNFLGIQSPSFRLKSLIFPGYRTIKRAFISLIAASSINGAIESDELKRKISLELMRLCSTTPTSSNETFKLISYHIQESKLDFKVDLESLRCLLDVWNFKRTLDWSLSRSICSSESQATWREIFSLLQLLPPNSNAISEVLSDFLLFHGADPLSISAKEYLQEATRIALSKMVMNISYIETGPVDTYTDISNDPLLHEIVNSIVPGLFDKSSLDELIRLVSSQIYPKQINFLGPRLLYAFYGCGGVNLALKFVKICITVEMLRNSRGNPGHIFRGNNYAVKVARVFAGYYGRDFLTKALRPVISRICRDGAQYELNPELYDGKLDLSETTKRMSERYTETMISILSTTIPPEIREICSHIALTVLSCPTHAAKDGSKPQLGSLDEASVIGAEELEATAGFLFSRIICHSIVKPQDFGIVNFAPDQRASRGLQLLATLVLNTAQGHRFGDNKPYLEQFNPIISRYYDQTREYLLGSVNVMGEKPTEVPSLTGVRLWLRINPMNVTSLFQTPNMTESIELLGMKIFLVAETPRLSEISNQEYSSMLISRAQKDMNSFIKLNNALRERCERLIGTLEAYYFTRDKEEVTISSSSSSSSSSEENVSNNGNDDTSSFSSYGSYIYTTSESSENEKTKPKVDPVVVKPENYVKVEEEKIESISISKMSLTDLTEWWIKNEDETNQGNEFKCNVLKKKKLQEGFKMSIVSHPKRRKKYETCQVGMKYGVISEKFKKRGGNVKYQFIELLPNYKVKIENLKRGKLLALRDGAEIIEEFVFDDEIDAGNWFKLLRNELGKIAKKGKSKSVSISETLGTNRYN